jgi:hydroxysqualene synthase
MTAAAEYRSGKGHRDENFPVASRLIDARHRKIILAFYDFVRTADDIADHKTLAKDDKLSLLDRLDAGLTGETAQDPAASVLRAALRERGLSPKHARDLLVAFRRDVTKLRYRDWDELIDYCSYSAMPVGRFVLDVHGEDASTWPVSDALCAALQIINHLQDCALDYRNLDRVYIPLDALAAAGTTVEALGAPRASPALRACLRDLAGRTGALLEQSRALPAMVNNTRLALEIAVIQVMARRLTRTLQIRDPLSERVHLGKLGMIGATGSGVMHGLWGRFRRGRNGACRAA